jgi:hypothetical protein
MEHSCIFRSQTRALRDDRDGREFEKKAVLRSSYRSWLSPMDVDARILVRACSSVVLARPPRQYNVSTVGVGERKTVFRRGTRRAGIYEIP